MKRIKRLSIKQGRISIMSLIETTEYDQDEYIRGMEYARDEYARGIEEYIENLMKMDEAAAKQKSFENLVKSNIINEDGSFVEYFENILRILD